MTRKEDPIWGPEDTARTACADTFHVTNAVPQTQPFNAPIWLGLEDYALEHARQDQMRISVFTGPIFGDSDPVRDGVKIPLEFFKVIAFIHDDTGKLCATGYTVSQGDSLSGEEFVFGEFKTYQVSIRSIEARTGHPLRRALQGRSDQRGGRHRNPAHLHRGDPIPVDGGRPPEQSRARAP